MKNKTRLDFASFYHSFFNNYCCCYGLWLEFVDVPIKVLVTPVGIPLAGTSVLILTTTTRSYVLILIGVTIITRVATPGMVQTEHSYAAHQVADSPPLPPMHYADKGRFYHYQNNQAHHKR